MLPQVERCDLEQSLAAFQRAVLRRPDEVRSVMHYDCDTSTDPWTATRTFQLIYVPPGVDYARWRVEYRAAREQRRRAKGATV